MSLLVIYFPLESKELSKSFMLQIGCKSEHIHKSLFEGVMTYKSVAPKKPSHEVKKFIDAVLLSASKDLCKINHEDEELVQFSELENSIKTNTWLQVVKQQYKLVVINDALVAAVKNHVTFVQEPLEQEAEIAMN